MNPNKASSKLNVSKSMFTNWGFSLNGFKTNKKGEWWLIAQLILIFAHLSPSIPLNLELTHSLAIVLVLMASLFFIAGIYIGLISLIALGDNLSPLPEPKQGSLLVTNMVYRYCRHPIYLALIVISISINLYLISISHFLLLISLCIILIGKARAEEKRLKSTYINYSQYMKDTPAIIKGLPFFDWRL